MALVSYSDTGAYAAFSAAGGGGGGCTLSLSGTRVSSP